MELDAALVEEARRLVTPLVRRTPVEASPILSEKLGVPVHFKLENLQETGSFKIRGASFVLSRLSAAERKRGVITCSAGNHGRAVATVAQRLGIRATIHVPKNVDESKFQAIRATGADVKRSAFDGFDDTERLAKEDAAASGKVWVSAYDDPLILAANGGTLAHEVLEDLPKARNFLVPVGGGGLGGGFAFVTKSRVPGSRFIACQHKDSAALALSLKRGEAVTTLPPIETTAGGLEGGIGRAGFQALASRVDHVSLISEAEIFQAVRWFLENHHYVMEPTSAVTVAALLTGKCGPLDGPTVAVISGRNVALPTLRKILASG